MNAIKNGYQGKPVEWIVNHFYGDITRWPLVSDGVNFTQGQIRAFAEHIHATGVNLWHAQAVVMDRPCNCMQCHKQVGK